MRLNYTKKPGNIIEDCIMCVCIIDAVYYTVCSIESVYSRLLYSRNYVCVCIILEHITMSSAQKVVVKKDEIIIKKSFI